MNTDFKKIEHSALKLNDKQRIELKEAELQIMLGEAVSHDEAKKEIRKNLGKWK